MGADPDGKHGGGASKPGMGEKVICATIPDFVVDASDVNWMVIYRCVAVMEGGFKTLDETRNIR